MTRYRSRASHEAAMYAAQALDARRAHPAEPPWSVAAQDAQEARDAADADRVRYVRVGGAVVDERDVPAEADR